MIFRELTVADKQRIIAGDREHDCWQQFPFYPLKSPGMPPAGNNFSSHAAATCTVAMPTAAELDELPADIAKQRAADVAIAQYDELSRLYFEAMYNGSDFCMPVTVKSRQESARIVPGHFWGCGTHGPRITADMRMPRVMLIGKMPGEEELVAGRNFYGAAGQQLHTTLRSAGVDEAVLGDWYLCNLVRWQHLLPQGGALPVAWVKDCLPILHQELRILKPDFILCMGAEATKAICGKTVSLQSMIGRCVEYTFPTNFMDEEPAEHTAQVMAVTHPSHVLRNTDNYPQFLATLRNFVALVRGESFTACSDAIAIKYVYKERELAAIVDEVIAVPGLKKIAVDAEWHGDHPAEPGAYMRTVQFSAADDEAVVVVLRYKGGGQAFMPSDAGAIRQLTRLLDRDDVQLIGHFFAADLPWLHHAGLDLRHRFTVPADVNVLRTGEYAGGFDTSLAAHAHNETAEFKLEVLASRLVDADRWDIELQQWLKSYCTDNKFKLSDIEGYGECPEEILLPYGGKDAAYTRKLRDIYVGEAGSADNPGLLNGDRYGNDCWLPFQIAMRAFCAFLEMHMVGIKVDRDRIDNLTQLFMDARESMLAEFRELINWPTFNPRSSQQCVELLFGERHTHKIDKTTGDVIRIRPAGAKCFGMQPVKTTGSRSKPWGRVVADGDADKYAPSTDKETCGILAGFNDDIRGLRDVRLIDQVLKSVFRPPVCNKAGELVLRDGKCIYDGGIASFICHDGRIRSFFSQHKETGRAGSSRPPLQNLCFDGDTEVLTVSGWVKAADVTVEDRVAQYWTASQEINFTHPQECIKQHYHGQLVHIHGKNVDQLVTPDHRCLLRHSVNGGYFAVRASSLSVRASAQYINAGKCVGGSEYLLPVLSRLLVAIQVVGSYAGDGICLRAINEEQVKRLQCILAGAGVAYEIKSLTGYVTWFYISRAKNHKLFSLIQCTLGLTSVFGDWLLQYPRSVLLTMCAELWYWCAAKEKAVYVSASEHSADWVQLLYTLSGYRARKSAVLNSRDDKYVAYDYRVTLSQPRVRRDYTAVKKCSISHVAWDDYVYCLRVPSSYVVTRRRGKVSITGNSKRRETDYARILGSRYQHKIRSFITGNTDQAAGPTTVLLAADYQGAELFGIATQACDNVMIDHCLRAMLPEDHPNHYDIHSNVAVRAFNLDCEPTKSGLRSINRVDLRVGAKNVIFGGGYGRSPEAISRQAKEEGVNMSPEDAKRVMDAIFAMYSGIPVLQQGLRERARTPGWVRNCFGRLRRVIASRDSAVQGELERQFLNFPFQSMVADAVSLALHYLCNDPRRSRLGYKIVLQLHDEIILEVPVEHLKEVYDEVLPECMESKVSFKACDFDGVPYSGSPDYHFSIDRGVMLRWGESLTKSQCQAHSIPEEFGCAD